jgi:hypothetical protein
MNVGDHSHNIRVAVDPTDLIQYGLMFQMLLQQLDDITVQYDKSGPNRTQWDVRRFAARQLGIVIRGVREASQLAERYPFIEYSCEDEREHPPELSTPMPLMVLLFEINELQNDRVSPLLAHNVTDVGFGAYHFITRYIQAGIAAGVQALIDTGMSQDAAASHLADTLKEKHFCPRLKPYTPAGIEDLYRRRKDKKKFPYDEWCVRFRNIRHRAARLSLPDDPCITDRIRADVVGLLKSSINVFGYRIAPR